MEYFMGYLSNLKGEFPSSDEVLAHRNAVYALQQYLIRNGRGSEIRLAVVDSDFVYGAYNEKEYDLAKAAGLPAARPVGEP